MNQELTLQEIHDELVWHLRWMFDFRRLQEYKIYEDHAYLFGYEPEPEESFFRVALRTSPYFGTPRPH